MTPRCALFPLAAALAAAPALAQTRDGGPDAARSTVVVIATRTPALLTEIGSAVTVIEAQDLRRVQATALVDVLRDIPGVTFNRNGGVGAVSSVRIRGAEADQTVLLIDGVKLNDPAAPGGGFNFANLLDVDVQRIEVLKGPQSTLYGGQAIGGVIAITTRSAAPGLSVGLRAEGGGLGTANARVRAGYGGARFQVAGAAGWYETEGISAFSRRRGGREADGYRSLGAHMRARVDIADQLSIDTSAWYADSTVQIDGFPAPLFILADTPERSHTREFIASGGVNLDLLDGRWRNRLAVSRTQIDRDSINPAAAVALTFTGLGETRRVEAQSTFDMRPDLELISGADWESARLRTASPSSFNPNPAPLIAQADLFSVYAQAQARPAPGLALTFGVREARDDRFGDATTTRATLAWAINGGDVILRASAGQGFKPPTPFQLFSAFGNSRLAPEKAFAWDAGVERSWLNGRATGGVTYFRRDSRNQIDFRSCAASADPICAGRPFGTYDNIARSFAEGVEASLEVRPSPAWRISAGYAALDARNRSVASANFNRRLARRPETTASIAMAYRFAGGHDMSLGVTRIGDSFDNASNTVRLKGYTLAALRGAFAVGRGLSVTARVENALDATYETTAGYGSVPRAVYVGLSGDF